MEFHYGQVIWVICFAFIIFTLLFPISKDIPIYSPSSILQRFKRKKHTKESADNSVSAIYDARPLYEDTVVLDNSPHNHSCYKFPLRLNMATAPVISVLLLLTTQVFSIDGTVRNGILGDALLQPWKVLLVFYTLSYLCISIDCTLLFLVIAERLVLGKREPKNNNSSIDAAASTPKRSPLALFNAIYCLSGFLTVFTSNDIVILVLTPMICHLTTRLSLPSPTPFLFAQFFAANSWSVIFYISNPTNLVVAMANGWGFVEYAKGMVLSAFAIALTVWIVLWMIYRRELNGIRKDQTRIFNSAAITTTDVVTADTVDDDDDKWQQSIDCSKNSLELKLNAEEKDNSTKLNGPIDAIFGAACLALCLIFLVVGEWLMGIENWMVVLVAAGMLFLFDIFRDITYFSKIERKKQIDCNEGILAENEIEMISTNSMNVKQMPPQSTMMIVSKPDHPISPITKPYHAIKGYLSIQFPKLSQIICRLPFGFIPFILGMFIMIEGLNAPTVGFMDPIASSLGIFLADNRPLAIYFIAFTSSILCNILNNQPMTILFSRIFAQPSFRQAVSPQVLRAGSFALAMGSNLGGNITLVGALAGLMWQQVLNVYRVDMGFVKFAKVGCLVMPIVILAGATMLLIILE